mmetsp:Transcript_17701/g.40031  ORF Transcript_17701/g.40031 Transcript_17701/m.40031 type:complete len:458 (+) Transcript_17701:3239-4612(+)
MSSLPFLRVVEGYHEGEVALLRDDSHVRLEVSDERLEALAQRVVGQYLAHPRPHLLPLVGELLEVSPEQPVGRLHGVQAAPHSRLQHLVNVDVPVPVPERGPGEDVNLLYMHAHLLDRGQVLLLHPMRRNALGHGEVHLEEREEAAGEVVQHLEHALLVVEVAGGEDAQEADGGAQVLHDAVYERRPGAGQLDEQAAAVRVQLLPQLLDVRLEVDPREEAKMGDLAPRGLDDPCLVGERVVQVPCCDPHHQLLDCHEAAGVDLRARVLALAQGCDQLKGLQVHRLLLVLLVGQRGVEHRGVGELQGGDGEDALVGVGAGVELLEDVEDREVLRLEQAVDQMLVLLPGHSLAAAEGAEQEHPVRQDRLVTHDVVGKHPLDPLLAPLHHQPVVVPQHGRQQLPSRHVLYGHVAPDQPCALHHPLLQPRVVAAEVAEQLEAQEHDLPQRIVLEPVQLRSS